MNRTSYRATAQAGFTLIEVMVVVVILGILAAVVVPNVMGAPGKARMTAAQNDVKGLESALDYYKLDNFQYPSTQQGLEALVTRPSGEPQPRNYKAEGYIKSLKKDPWGNPYQYMNPGKNGAIDIFSYGADGKPGGEGEDADIGNWVTNS